MNEDPVTCEAPRRTDHLRRLRRRDEHGIALVTGLVTLALTVTVGSLLLRDSRRQAQAAINQEGSTKAQFAAERAVGDAMDRLLGRASPPIDTSNPGNTGVIGSGQWPAAGVATDHGYSYTVAPRLVNGSPVLDASGRPYYQIDATGTSGPARRRVQVMLSLTRSPGIWGDAIIGCHGVTLKSNGATSSYRGTETGRNQASVRTLSNLDGVLADILLDSAAVVRGPVRAFGGLILDSSATLAGDGYANSAVQVKSSAVVQGNAYAGGVITTDKSTGVAGTRNPNQSPAPVATEPCDPLGIDDQFTANALPIATNNNNSQYNLSAGASSVTWGADNQATRLYLASNTMIKDRTRTIRGDVTIYAAGNLTIDGTTRIIMAPGAKLTIYLNGKFYMDSNTVFNWPTNSNTGYGNPANVVLYTRFNDTARRDAADKSGFGLNSNSRLSALVYAPRTHVYLDSSTRHAGSLRGKWVNFNSNGLLAYDEGLKDVGGGPVSGYRLALWSDVPFDSYGP